jgi:putative N6-adenine-specific DNA methylase
MSSPDFEIFLVTAPGLESALLAEAREKRFREPKIVKGGVTVMGDWPEVWRANLELRGASRVLARIAEFRAMHPAQLDKRAHKVAWGDVLRGDVPFRVDAACKASRIYHEGAAAERIERAIKDTIGAPLADDAEVVIKARIDDDLCTISIDTSGESLHKRGHKQAVAKAPMRENLAALFLRQCGYDGTEPVVDPLPGIACAATTRFVRPRCASTAVTATPARRR